MPAVCFDLDGVLIHTMPMHAAAWEETLKARGLRVSRRSIYEWEGESGTVTARRLLRRHGRDVSDHAIAELLRDKERRFKRLAGRVRVDPPLETALAALSRRSVPFGLVTGTSSREVHRVVSRALLRAFRIVITGDCVRRGKPHPEPYRRAFHALGVQPAQAIVVENAPYGIRSARRASAGLVVALASSLPSRFLRDAHIIVGSVEQLCELLDRLTRPARQAI